MQEMHKRKTKLIREDGAVQRGLLGCVRQCWVGCPPCSLYSTTAASQFTARAQFSVCVKFPVALVT